MMWQCPTPQGIYYKREYPVGRRIISRHDGKKGGQEELPETYLDREAKELYTQTPYTAH